MAKRSRRPSRGEPAASHPQPQPPATPSTESGESSNVAGTSSASSSPSSAPRTSSTSTTRTSTSRPRSRRTREQTFFERYRTLIFGGAAVIGLLLVGWIFLQSASGASYTCDSLLTPGPVESVTPRPPTPTPTASPSATPTSSATASGSPAASGSPGASGSPAASATPTASPSASPSPTPAPTVQPDPTPRLGFATTILPPNHVRDQTINYGFCPPTSGEHYNAANRGPIRAGVYPSTTEQTPGGWVHNLEHGYVVALYRCTGPDDCPTDEEMAQMQAFYDQATFSSNQNCVRKVVVARFDQMDKPFALLAWGRALLLDEFDLDTALTFAEQWTEHEAVPEPGLC